jgi:hypothetical protein
MPEKWNLVLKIAAAIFSAVYGFYATVTDFRVEKHGEKVLSRKGYVGVALLMLATAVSISSDHYKEKEDEKAAQKMQGMLDGLTNKANLAASQLNNTRKDLEAQVTQSTKISGDLTNNLEATRSVGTKLADTSKQLQRQIEQSRGISRDVTGNLEATRSVLAGLQRAADPMGAINYAEIELTIPANQAALQSYLQRVSSLKPGQFTEKDQGFPNRLLGETDLAILTTPDVTVDFSPASTGRDSRKSEAFLRTEGSCGARDAGIHLQILRDPDKHKQPISLKLACNYVPIVSRDFKKLVTFSDLNGSDVFIWISYYEPEDTIDYNISSFRLTTTRREELTITHFSVEDCKGGMSPSKCLRARVSGATGGEHVVLSPQSK